MSLTTKPQCPVQRVSLSDAEVRASQATCPLCKRTIRVRPNRGLKQATMSAHVSGEENLAKKK